MLQLYAKIKTQLYKYHQNWNSKKESRRLPKGKAVHLLLLLFLVSSLPQTVNKLHSCVLFSELWTGVYPHNSEIMSFKICYLKVAPLMIFSCLFHDLIIPLVCTPAGTSRCLWPQICAITVSSSTLTPIYSLNIRNTSKGWRNVSTVKNTC